MSAPVVTEPAPKEPGARWGVGLRLRQVHVLQGVLELFVGEVPGNQAHIGYGLELLRQKGNFVFSLGVEYERLDAAEGLWLEKGDSVPQDEPDLVEFDNFGWVGVDFNFVWQADLTEMLAFRYGAGLGLGVVLGEVLRTDYVCPTAELAEPPCMQRTDPPAENQRAPEEDVPPVFPIVNMVLGIQVRPVDSLAINLEGGIRSLFPFVGTSLAYMF